MFRGRALHVLPRGDTCMPRVHPSRVTRARSVGQVSIPGGSPNPLQRERRVIEGDSEAPLIYRAEGHFSLYSMRPFTAAARRAVAIAEPPTVAAMKWMNAIDSPFASLLQAVIQHTCSEANGEDAEEQIPDTTRPAANGMPICARISTHMESDHNIRIGGPKSQRRGFAHGDPGYDR